MARRGVPACAGGGDLSLPPCGGRGRHGAGAGSPQAGAGVLRLAARPGETRGGGCLLPGGARRPASAGRPVCSRCGDGEEGSSPRSRRRLAVGRALLLGYAWVRRYGEARLV